jgi:hypothetical protein
VSLERFAESFEGLTVEFGELVEKENAVVGEGDLAGLRNGAAADECGGRAAVMRSAEGTTAPVGEVEALMPRDARVATSRASMSERGGRSPGRRWSSMLLPVPGLPTRRRRWWPAAAISSALLA